MTSTTSDYRGFGAFVASILGDHDPQHDDPGAIAALLSNAARDFGIDLDGVVA